MNQEENHEVDEKKSKKQNMYLSNKELRAITKKNNKTIRELERKKRRKHVPEKEYTTQMRDPNNIIEFDNLHTYFFTDVGTVKSVDGVSFDVPKNSIVGVVGESGCGKSVTSLSLMQLVQAPQGQIVEGEIRFQMEEFKKVNGKNIPVYETELDENGNEQVVMEEVTSKNGVTTKVPKVKLDKYGFPMYEKVSKVYDITKIPMDQMRKIRGSEISMIFQEPMTSLNPVFTIGYQLDEVTLLHIPNATKEMAKQKSIEMLKLVGIAMPENVYTRYPHQLSGGMRQRVMIAMALACNPKVIVADEPTTALDVTIQAQILDLLKDIKQKINGSIVLITHDLGVIANMADYVVVMYAGRVVEKGTVRDIFKNPLHPYTIGLQKSKPVVNRKVDRLYSIPGQVPSPIAMPNYCYFKDRCNRCIKQCDGAYPEMIQVTKTHSVACYLYEAYKDQKEVK